MNKHIKKLIGVPLLLMALIMAIVPVASTLAAPPEYIISTINQGDAPNFIYGINASGDLVGTFYKNGPGFSIINGELKTYPVEGSSLIGIGPSCDIVGDYPAPDLSDYYYHWHGFIIPKDGVPTDINSGYDTTVPWRILPDGTIIGHVQENPSNPFTRYGFVMRPDGSIDVNYSMPFSQHNSATPDGKIIVGSYLYDPTTFEFCGYVLENGNLTKTFDIPGAFMTLAWDVDPSGNVVVGWYMNGTGAHGFLANRSETGSWKITDFNVPGANQTLLLAISPGGELAGTYFDGTGAHGFVASRNNRK